MNICQLKKLCKDFPKSANFLPLQKLIIAQIREQSYYKIFFFNYPVLNIYKFDCMTKIDWIHNWSSNFLENYKHSTMNKENDYLEFYILAEWCFCL